MPKRDKATIRYEIGDKFKFQSKTYTASGFFGETGIEYPTSLEAAAANGLATDEKICIKIKETGGACRIDMLRG